MPNKPQLHQSQILRMSDCGEYYRLRYVEGRSGPSSPWLLVGSAVHHTIAQDLRTKLDTGSLLPMAAVRDHARDDLVAEWDGVDVVLNGDGVTDAMAKGQAIDRAISLSTLHHFKVAPNINPLAIEQKGVIALKGYPFDIALQKDIVEPGVIRDTKTTSKKPPVDAAKFSFQLQLYAIHQTLKDGKPPGRLVLDHLVHSPGGQKTYHVETTTAPTPERREWVLAMIVRTAANIEKGAFQPNPGSWLCSQTYCEFARMGACKFWSGRE